jgi:hypothetical protein
MDTIQIQKHRPEAALIGKALLSTPSQGWGDVSQSMVQRLAALTEPTPTFLGNPARLAHSLEEQLYDALAVFKVRTALVAMHLDRGWRSKLFDQLDSLLALEDWAEDDPPPSIESYSTFLRMLTLLRPHRRPGLGATIDGHLIATWTIGGDRLTIECLPKDIARWHLTVTIDGERERAAAETPLQRLNAVLGAYDPRRWFDHAHNLPTA